MSPRSPAPPGTSSRKPSPWGAPGAPRDTAGLRPARDRLEELGIRRTRERLAQADLVLYLVDGSEPCSPEDRAALQELAAAVAWW